MNIKEYISSGIMESYVLGLASSEERREFEEYCDQYPELLQARIDFEVALEKAAMANAVTPPAELKSKILSLRGEDIARPTLAPVRSMNWLKYAVAACLVLLAGSVYWNINLLDKNKRLTNNYDSTIAKLDEVQNDIRVIQQNPNIKMASMKGLDIAPQSFATVYWDTTSKDVYLLINNLPAPASDKQYQLWSLLDGKPIDAGMIDNSYFVHQNKLLLRMKNAQGAQAFAITLEKKGGSPTPQGTMYVKGNL